MESDKSTHSHFGSMFIHVPNYLGGVGGNASHTPHLWSPELLLGVQQIECTCVVCRHPPGSRQQVSVCLVHHDQVCHLHNASFHALRGREGGRETHTPTHKHSHSLNTHTCANTRTHSHTYMCKHSHSLNTHTCANTHTHSTHIHVQTLALTHTHTCANTRTHSHTYTRTDL